MEGFGYSIKLGIEKANLEAFRGEGVGLIYSTYLPTQMTSDIQTQKGSHSPSAGHLPAFSSGGEVLAQQISTPIGICLRIFLTRHAVTLSYKLWTGYSFRGSQPGFYKPETMCHEKIVLKSNSNNKELIQKHA